MQKIKGNYPGGKPDGQEPPHHLLCHLCPGRRPAVGVADQRGAVPAADRGGTGEADLSAEAVPPL